MNLENFASVSFSRNFADAKIRENKTLVKCDLTLSLNNAIRENKIFAKSSESTVSTFYDLISKIFCKSLFFRSLLHSLRDILVLCGNANIFPGIVSWTVYKYGSTNLLEICSAISR